MGMAAGGAAQGGGGRRRRARRSAPIADINMTPFIDVMLVLLIIFMVTAPLMTAGVPLDLPKTGAGQLNVDQKPVTISINDKAQIFLGETPITLADIPTSLKAQVKQGFDERIYVRGAKQVDYGTVAQVMSAITSAGYKRVALLTEQDHKK
jgi:biopolymer transport protein TolR